MKRGRRPGGVDTRAEIIEAARSEFAELGFDNATLRGVARRAGVDPALIHHYFTDKGDLFHQTLEVPAAAEFSGNIEKIVDSARDDELGELIVRAFLEQMEDPGTQEAFIAMARAAVTFEDATRSTRQFLARKVISNLIQRMHPDHELPELRSSLITSILYGVGLGRYVTKTPAMVNASVDDIVRHAGRLVQASLDGVEVTGRDQVREQREQRIALAS